MNAVELPERHLAVEDAVRAEPERREDPEEGQRLERGEEDGVHGGDVERAGDDAVARGRRSGR